MSRSSSSTATQPQRQRTTLVISNIHCPSCVSSIESIFNESSAAFCNVSVSIVDGTVSFDHSGNIGSGDIRAVIRELETAGFEVSSDDGYRDARARFMRHLHRPAARQASSATTRFSDLWHAYGRPSSRRRRAHRETCSACQMEEAYEKKGAASLSEHEDFLADLPAGGQSNAGGRSWSAEEKQEQWNVVLSVDSMTCASCTSAITNAISDQPGVSNFEVSLIGGSASFKTDHKETAEIVRETIDDLGYDCSVVSVEPIESAAPLARKSARQQRISATFAIGGMTCASCVASITKAVRDITGVSSFEVDLMGQSGTAIVSEEGTIAVLKQVVEDLGYECEEIRSERKTLDRKQEGDATTPERHPSDSKPRTVNVRIDGFFCEDCPSKVRMVLDSLARRYDIIATAATLDRPYSSLTYTPEAPDFTLRTLRTEVAKLGFTLSVVQPETLQDRTKRVQARERHRLLLRLLIAVIFCVPTSIFGVIGPSLLHRDNRFRMWLDQPIWGNAARFKIALLVLATPVQFGVGSLFYVRSYKSLRAVWRRRHGNVARRKLWAERLLRWGSMDSLVALGTTVAWVSSLAYLVLDIMRAGPSNEMGFFDTSVFLITFILAGRYLESVSRQKTGDALTELSKLRPKKGLVQLADGTFDETEAAFIERGDKILVPVGAAPPVDGVLDGSSSLTAFDESSLTGESRPAAKTEGDAVYAGCLNAGPSPALVQVTHRDGETVLDSIASGIRNAMSKKAGIERIADSITAIFVPVVVGIACLTLFVWIMRGYLGDLPTSWLGSGDGKRGTWALFAIQFSVAVLVVACPCGIGLAAPTAQLVGVGLAARNGIMPNGGGEAFQTLSKIDAIVFDKTGTLTLGKFKVAAVVTKDACETPLLWKSLAVIEQASSHPIALAVHAHATAQAGPGGEVALNIDEISEIPGKGMSATLSQEGHSAAFKMSVGNLKLMQDVGASISDDIESQLQTWQRQGMSTVLVSYQSEEDSQPQIAAAIAVTDPLRPEASFILQELECQGVDVFIVSGDAQRTVEAVAEQLHVPRENIVGSASPEDKKSFIERLQSRPRAAKHGTIWMRERQTARNLVAMVGDGVNDSIALAHADVSIALGSGSQVATTTADFALLSDSLLSILVLQGVSRATYRRIISNFVWACLYNVVLIPVAAGAFYDLGQTKLPAVWASLAMALSSLSVVTNSLLLRWTFRLPKAVHRWRSTSA